MTTLPSKREWGELSEEMRALPNDRWRAYVEYYLLEPGTLGAQTRAATAAGFKSLKRDHITRIASRLMRDPRMIAALQAEAKRMIRSGAVTATKALFEIVNDVGHKDRIRAIDMVLARSDPAIAVTEMSITHRVLDPDQEALEELRALRALGTPQEKLLELFGSNGLARIERLEAADTARRADSAKIIDAEVTDG